MAGFRRLADRFRHFARLAVTEADATLLVADDDERSKAEAASALHDFSNSVDMDEAINEFAVALLPVMVAAAAAFTFTCHLCFRHLRGASHEAPLAGTIGSEVEAAFASALGERLDTPVIHVAAAVEHDLVNTRSLGALGEFLADAA